MDEKIFELSFEIISFAGNAKSIAFDAISKAKAGEIEKARELLKESKEEVNKAHRCQTSLIQKEACGEKVEMSVVLIHAQDHLMNTMNFQMLAEEIIDLYERIDNK
ncbi:PTS lactose/cellobiose transporter subunit IIA [[Clostridium] dakarense]|uniref:PTS lactose/cellobiose transporter subunit IIA n=1 Tax=Faecalimicrobium dakarense TaxID=1301100 RepID=UPI0004B635E1|nr:PTS lactose/cellobiose transporter subunit IIA [[Clostridium] dakarense]